MALKSAPFRYYYCVDNIENITSRSHESSVLFLSRCLHTILRKPCPTFLNIWCAFRGQNQKKLTPSTEENSTVSLRRNVHQYINDMPVFAETLKFTERTLRETVTSQRLHSFCSLSYDLSIASSNVSFPNSVI